MSIPLPIVAGLGVVLLIVGVACPKVPPPFEGEAGDNGGVEMEENSCAECEDQLQKALEDASLWKELAEHCVSQTTGVRKRK